MPNLIQNLWIVTYSGTVLYEMVLDAKIKAQLLGSLLSALEMFSEKLTEGGLNSFELSTLRFTILKMGNILFVANADKKIKEKKIQENLKKISAKFFDKYSDSLENWDGDINIFSEFGDNIKADL